MKKHLLTLFLAYALTISIANAQGIQFGSFPKGWSEIIASAKAEHKGIFVDCYATWCGPCKAMDADIYPKEEVGKVYNNQFICVRLQMDQIATDNNLTKGLYGFAKWLGDFCNVNAYPTFLFFDDNGNPIHKAVGYQDEKQFIQLASDAQNPDKQYYRILKNFQPGKLDTADEKGLANYINYTDRALAGKIAADYLGRIPQKEFSTNTNAAFITRFSSEPAVISIIAHYYSGLSQKQLKNPGYLSLIRSLSSRKEINAIAQRYIEKLSEKEMYEPINLEFIKGTTDSSVDRGFKFFYANAVKIDTIMHYDTWAKQLLDRVIYKEECEPVITKAKADKQEPDWMTLSNKIQQKFGSLYVPRNVLKARVTWYEFTKQWNQYSKYFIEQRAGWNLNAFGTSGINVLNSSADLIFQHSNNQAELETALKWVDRALELGKDHPNAFVMDTRASLLYKLGRTAEALALEEKAASLTGFQPIHDNYQKMQNGLPTWNVR